LGSKRKVGVPLGYGSVLRADYFALAAMNHHLITESQVELFALT